MGFASHFAQREIAALLAPMSRDVWNLAHLGMRERLRELFDAEPTLANAVHARLGFTPLFALPDDEDEAADMATFLLTHGADATVRNSDGLTPEKAARQRGLIEAADLMRAAKPEAVGASTQPGFIPTPPLWRRPELVRLGQSDPGLDQVKEDAQTDERRQADDLLTRTQSD